MFILKSRLKFLLPLLLLTAGFARAEFPLRTIHESANPSNAVLRVFADRRSPYPISRYINGKFSEHLGANIYGGMDAQILENPTFADVPFRTGEQSPSGIAKFVEDDERIDALLRWRSPSHGWPTNEIPRLLEARRDSFATYWTRVGSREDVVPSPDTGPFGGRAQRVGVRAGGQGIAQWTYLPLHRTREYEFEILLRAPGIKSFSVSLAQETNALAVAQLSGVSGDWQKFTGILKLDSSFSDEAPCRFSLLADSPGQFVVQRVLLRPADHIDGADPEIVRLLKESELPILRWPGGNFVSAYHWQDGIGPFENRPTVPNFAWGGAEPNLFGTDEFMKFCKAVGCEPMICVNAGTGTPEEAARWIEYCNGPTNSPMGKLRAANGHPEPYNVKHWEVGNELWGKWQPNWTTPHGNVDRYLRFSKTMLAADSTITLYGCGAPVLWGKNWNDTLISRAGKKLETITDHSLVGGPVDRSTAPLDVYRDFMAAPEVLAEKWAKMRDVMKENGIESPHLALTELQIFPDLGGRANSNAPVRLNGSNLVGATTQAEALYDILFYHTAIRLSPFFDLITHSATVNHGGGLRKYKERVYANPCYYAQKAFAPLRGATPVAVEIECAVEKAPLVVPDLRNAVSGANFGAIDAIAAVSEKELWLSIVHRGSSGPINLTVELSGIETEKTAEIRTLSAETPWSANQLNAPANIAPVDSNASLQNGKLSLKIAPYSVLRVRLPK